MMSAPGAAWLRTIEAPCAPFAPSANRPDATSEPVRTSEKPVVPGPSLPTSTAAKLSAKFAVTVARPAGALSPSSSLPTGRVSSRTSVSGVALATTAFGPSSSIWNTPAPRLIPAVSLSPSASVTVCTSCRSRGVRQRQRRGVVVAAGVGVPDVGALAERHHARRRVDADAEVFGRTAHRADDVGTRRRLVENNRGARAPFAPSANRPDATSEPVRTSE